MSPQREIYRPSGRVRWDRLALGFVLSLPLTLLSGYLLCVALRLGIYLMIVVPLAAALPAAGGTWMTVWMSKCRNRWVGALTGLLAGVIAYISFYQFDLAHESGARNLHRLDLLPQQIWLRMHTDRVVRIIRDVNPRAAKPPGAELDRAQMVLGWCLFALDAFCVMIVPAAVGWTRSKRPFSEQRQRWLFEHQVMVSTDRMRELAQILEENDAEALADAAEPAPMNPVLDQGVLKIYYIPYEPATPVYLGMMIRQGVISWRFWSQPVLSPTLLTAEEGAALVRRLRPPGAKVVEVLAVEPVGAAPPSTISATIDSLPPDEVGKVMGGRTVTLLAFINLLPLLAGLSIIIAIVAALILFWSALPFVLNIALIGLAIAVLVGAFVLTAMYADYLPMRLQHDWCAAAIKRRLGPLVDPDDPAAFYVGIIPRKNWGRLMAENAEDIGFLKIDPQRRVLLFEGDKERWSIPAASVESCEPAEFCIGLPEPKESNVMALVVLRANVNGQRWEGPICPVKVTVRRPPGPVRRKWRRELLDAIREQLLGEDAEI